MAWRIRGVASRRFPFHARAGVKEFDDKVIKQIHAVSMNRSPYAFLRVYRGRNRVVNAAKLFGGLSFHLGHRGKRCKVGANQLPLFS